MNDRKYNFAESFFLRKNLLLGSTFSALISNYFKSKFLWLKMQKTVQEIQLIPFINLFLQFFTPKTWFVFKKRQNSEHLKVFLAYIFCFRCFSKFWCWFLAFTEGVKSASLKQILARPFFIFYQPYESIIFYLAGFF